MSHSIHEIAGLSDAPALAVSGAWETVFQGAALDALEACLPHFVLPRRWFGSKARAMRDIRIVEIIPIPLGRRPVSPGESLVPPVVHLTLLRVEYTEGDGETYVLPIAFATGATAQALGQERPAAVIATLQAGQESGILYDAVYDSDFCQALFETIGQCQHYHGVGGDLVASATSVLRGLRGDAEQSEPLPAVLLGVEQSNTSVRFGERFILKLYRRLEVGVNPDQEIGQFLTAMSRFANTPPVAGVLEFRPRGDVSRPGEPITVALLQSFVPNHGDAWRYTLDALSDYFADARSLGEAAAEDLALPQAPLLDLVRGDSPAQVEQLIGAYLGSARLLGRRTAELHLALNSDPADPVFAPEPFTPEFQGYLHRGMRNLADRIMHLLQARTEDLPQAARAEARQVLGLQGQITARFDTLSALPIRALRSRIHGDYHLGQVLYTGEDFMIIDFEGEPARPLSERRMKRSPLQDVAGMLRSFHYAAYAAYFSQDQDGAPPPELEVWARFWHLWVSVAYLKAYLEVADGAAFLPDSPDELRLLLDAFLVEKAVYELGYELNNRPGWVRIPLQGILQTIVAA